MLSCRKVRSVSDTGTGGGGQQESVVTTFTPGNPLENPYSVANMRKALEKLAERRKRTKSALPVLCIEPTHLYVRFLPESWEQ